MMMSPFPFMTKRPVKHQVRQTQNATFTYHRKAEVDWLAHIDVDEFLWPAEPLAPLLAALPADIPYARVRPIEALSGCRVEADFGPFGHVGIAFA